MNSARDVRSVDASINVTPMVDVMLVLLVIFMVTAPMLGANIGVRLPSARARPAPAPRSAIHVSIDRASQVRIGDAPGRGDVVSAAKLGDELAARRKACGDCTVVLAADESATYGSVALVLGSLQAASIQDVSLSVKPLAMSAQPPSRAGSP